MTEWFQRKACFNFHMQMALGRENGSRNYLDLQYSYTFVHSIELYACVPCTNFRSQASILSEQNTVFFFAYRKAKVTKFSLAVKWIKVTPGSSFEQTMMGRSPKCYIPSFVEIGTPVPYIGVAAILVIRPECREQIFVPLPKEIPHKI